MTVDYILYVLSYKTQVYPIQNSPKDLDPSYFQNNSKDLDPSYKTIPEI